MRTKTEYKLITTADGDLSRVPVKPTKQMRDIERLRKFGTAALTAVLSRANGHNEVLWLLGVGAPAVRRYCQMDPDFAAAYCRAQLRGEVFNGR